MKASFLARIGAFLLVLAASASPARAQGGYFGQNKVQYHEFKFQVLKTEHFDVYFYSEEEQAARMAAEMAERWYTRLSRLLTHNLRTRQPLILYAAGTHFRQTNTIEGDIGEGTGGVTEAYKRRIVLPFAGPIESTDHVIGHELVHAFQYDITNTNVGSQGAESAGALNLPLWFIEGMAEYLSVGPVDPLTAMWMRDSAHREKLPDVKNLDNPKYFPYRYGQALWAYIGGKYGDETVNRMLRVCAARGRVDECIKDVLGIDEKQLSKDWHNAEFQAYRPVAEVTKMPAQFARPLITREQGGEMNVSPEVSPDGSKMMFFSEKDLFSIDLYLADARTGKVIRKVTDTATSAHFESLQFLESAGAWDSTSRKFVFPGISAGQPVLTIIDAEKGSKEREIRIKELDEILNPAWSPDGRYIAFSGLVAGYNDLFIYDLQASSLRRLTTDSFAELDPAFSPDGRMLAFATDRFTTKLGAIDAGNYRLAVMDVASGNVRDAGGFDGAKNINPTWSQDGQALYFLSDRQGITNVYRIPLAGGQPTQLTNLLTGVSGITALSPALSAGGGRLVFSAYQNDGYDIYALDTPDALAGSAETQLPRNAAVLPPRTTGEGPVFAAVSNPNAGLKPAAAAGSAQDYKPGLQLLTAGQPMVGVGTDPFGTYAAGGVSLLFSDMLGNHMLATSFQATSRLDEIGGGALYINRTHRWNWGVSVDQTPYVSSAFAAGFLNNTYVEQEYRILQTDRGFSGLISYPFSRAQRVEVNAGLRQIGLKEDVTTYSYDPFTGQPLGRDKQTLATFPTLNLAQTGAALVYDTSIFGATSPIRGNRYRLELSQSAGSLTYTGLLADVRTYQMPVRPFTFALRGLYYGRFGTDAGDFRLPVLYLGYPGLVRGYDPNSFQGGECGGSIDGSCPAFDRLVGNRVGVASAEFRFPIWGAFGGGRNFYGPLPVEAAVFADSGIAWGVNNYFQNTNITKVNGKAVSSVGAAIRANLMGFAIAEIDYVRPLDRPGRGWLWQFNLMPGF